MGAGAFLVTASLFVAPDAMAQTVEQDSEQVKPKLPTGSVHVGTFEKMSSSEAKKVRQLSDTPVVYSREELVQELSKQMLNFQEVVQVKYMGTLANGEISKIFKEAIHLDDYTYGTWNGAKYAAMTRENPTITINMKYHHTQAQEQELTTAVEDIVSTIIQPTMTEMEKVKAINDYVVLNTVYTYEGTGTKTTVHSPYTMINEGKGVCQAYALIAYRLLKEAGIEARYVTGYAREYHAWNLVKLDGQWYHLDTTWNDPLFDKTAIANSPKLKDYKRYRYFLLSDKSMEKDHQIDQNGYPKTPADDYVVGLANSDVNILRLTISGQSRWVFSEPLYTNNTWYVNDSKTGQILRLKDGKQDLVSAGQPAYGMTAANGKIFFLNNYAYLYSYQLATGEVQQLTKQKVYIENDGKNLTAISTQNNHVVYQEKIGDVLETVDKTALQNVLAEATGYLSEVTGSTYRVLYEQIKQGNAVLKDNGATIETVNVHVNELRKVVELIKQADNRQKLYWQIGKATSEETKIAGERFIMLKEAIARAGDVYNDKLATEQELEDARKRLAEDLVDVKKEADKTLLKKTIEEAGVLLSSIYNEELDVALKKANQTIQDEWVTNETVDAEVANLREVLVNVYKNNLNRIQLDAKIVDATKYAKTLDAVSAKKLLQEIVKAKNVFKNPDATDEEIQQAFELLTKAMQVSATKLDAEILEKLLDEAIYEATMVTGEDARMLLEAVDQARLVLKQATSQQEIDDAINVLQKIVDTVKNTRMFNENISQFEDFFTADFRNIAEELIAQYNQMNLNEVSPEMQQRMLEIREKHEQLLQFNDTLTAKQAWSSVPKETTDAWKSWTVTLSSELENSEDNLKNFQVLNMFGKPVQASIAIDGKKVIVTPLEQYKADVIYTLVINKELKSMNGKTMKKDLYMEFKVK